MNYFTRTTLLMLALLGAFAAQTQGQSGFCPSTAEIGHAPLNEYWLEGSIGSKAARMYVAADGEAAVGAFYFTEDWVPILLGGRWSRNVVDLSDKTRDSVGTSRLRGKLDSNGLVGSWIASSSSKELSVRLKTAPRPDCKVANGAWVRFDDPEWPVTFSYPASWRLEKTKSGIKLVCPDPSLMAYEGFDVTLSHGTGNSDNANGFIRCGDKWYQGNCDCGRLTGLFCDRAVPMKKEHGMTILNGDAAEWRGYCRDGGYLGQVYGHRRVLLIDSRWVELNGEGPPSEVIDRIANTVEPR